MPAPDDNPKPPPPAIAARARRELERSALRARNGIEPLAGVDRPHLGRTPKDVGWRAGRCELWRYRAAGRPGGPASAPPLVIVSSLVGRSYVLDLRPGDSFVERLLAAGFDVYLLDWGVRDGRDAADTLEDYTGGFIPAAIEHVRRLSRSDDVFLLGYCLGGVLALLYAAHHPAPLRGLITIAAPVDFSRLTGFGELPSRDRIEIDTLLDGNGNVPAVVVRELFRLLRPAGRLARYASLLENVWRDEHVAAHQAMTQWSHDHVPFPGGVARQLVDMLVVRNALVDRTATLGGDPVDLGDISYPFLGVLATRDHIVPAAAAAPVVELVGSRDKRLLAIETGHMGLAVGRSAARQATPAIVEFVRTHSSPRPLRPTTAEGRR